MIRKVTEIYMKLYCSSKLGEIRRTIKRECLEGRKELLLNYSSHTGRGLTVAQSIIPREHESRIRKALLAHDDIEELLAGYDLIDLPPNKRKKGQRREKAV